MANMAWAENAVIIQDDGTSVKYHPKCPYCGKVDTCVTSHAHVAWGISSGFTGSCNKCVKLFDIRFGRG